MTQLEEQPSTPEGGIVSHPKNSKPSKFKSFLSSSRFFIFIVLFAAVGVILLIHSFASTGVVMDSSYLVPSQSSAVCTQQNNVACYSIVSETSGSKKNARVMELAAANKTMSTHVALSANTFDKGVWKFCLAAKSLGGTATGTLQVFNYNNGPVNTMLGSMTFSVSNTNEYKNAGCLNNISYTGSSPAMEVIVTSDGPAMRLGSVVASRTGDNPTPPQTDSGSAPTSPPFVACGTNRDSTMISPFTTSALAKTAFPNTNFVDVKAGDNSSLDMTANTTYWFEAGTHTVGNDQFAQFSPENNDVFVGAPGAIIDGKNVARYAFTQQAKNVKIEYLEIKGFNSPNSEGVVNHDFGVNWAIRYNNIHNNHGAGVFMGPDTTVDHNCIDHNGAYGFQGGANPGVDPVNETLTYNEISYNDNDHVEVSDPGCGCQGGGKFWGVHGATVTYNYVHNNYSVGIWADTNNSAFDIEHNYIADNVDNGIIYETSYNFKIDNNNFIRNDWHGVTNGGFPEAAVYISESGGDSRVSPTFAQSSVSNNIFTDNWGGVTLWENADRYCTSPADSSTGYCTLVNSLWSGYSTPKQCSTSLIKQKPYIDDCRWKTQNVTVAGNKFNLTAANVPKCTRANGCGYVALLSNSGSNMGNGDPYLGDFVQNNILYHQNNLFKNNTYKGPWQFQPFDQATVKTLAQWQASPYNQDAGSTITP